MSPDQYSFPGVAASLCLVALPAIPEGCQFVDESSRVVDFLRGPPVEGVHVRGGAIHLLRGSPSIDAHDLPEQVRERLPFGQHHPCESPGHRSRLVEDRRRIGRLRRPVPAVVTDRSNLRP